jgi:hypothetical protein
VLIPDRFFWGGVGTGVGIGIGISALSGATALWWIYVIGALAAACTSYGFLLVIHSLMGRRPNGD